MSMTAALTLTVTLTIIVVAAFLAWSLCVAADDDGGEQ